MTPPAGHPLPMAGNQLKSYQEAEMRSMVKNFLVVLDLTPGHMGGLHIGITK